jgi:hypothetical protein
MLQKSSSSSYFKNIIPACFIVFYIIRYSIYRITFDFARMKMCFKSEARGLTIFRPKNRQLNQAWF